MPRPQVLDGHWGVDELEEQHAFPEWTDRAMFIGFLTVALLTAMAQVESRWLFCGLLALAVLPSAIDCVRPIASGTYAVMVLIPLAIINWAPASVGLQDPPHGHSQINLLMATLLVGQTVATASRQVMVPVIVACFALPVGRLFVDDQFDAFLIWMGAVVIGVTIGAVMRRLIESMGDLKAAEVGLAEKAATDERQRIAREVHDVIAHSMTVTMLHVTAARLAVARGDDDAATEALLEAEKAGRESLNEIRHTVGLLRTEPDGGIEAPQPGVGDIVQLVDGFAEAGVDVHLDLDGGLDGVSPPVGLTLFRVVQESLANAVRHQPGSSTVVSVTAGDEVHVRVLSEGGKRRPTNGCIPGNGIQGMRERVEALHGSLSAGPAGRSAWLVECHLPEASS